MHPGLPRPSVADRDIERAVESHGRGPAALLPVLQSLHADRGRLEAATLRGVAAALKLPEVRVQGVASFYSQLADLPAGTQGAIHLCDGIACWLRGAGECRQRLEQVVAGRSGWQLLRSSCLGLCDRAPAALINRQPVGPLVAADLDAGTDPASPLAHEEVGGHPPRPGERRVLLERAGRIDPRSIEAALAAGVYRGLDRALTMTPGEVIQLIEQSGLRGRGGAGFPTGRKWRLTAAADDAVRYVVCNADESEPLMFKDRVLLESDPHSVLEGIAIAAYAVGAAHAWVYIRGEYEPQARLLEHAIAEAQSHGWLGAGIAGSSFSLSVEVHRGAGAYICGEETALLESLEGRRGEPRVRPPYPVQAGLGGRPTAVNNVETLAAAAAVLRDDAVRTPETKGAAGTRLFTLLGDVARPGLVEVPVGLTLRELIDRFGGGLREGCQFRFALTGGAAGTFVTEQHLDVPLDYDAWRRGVSVGSGGVLVCGDGVSPVALLRELMHFFEAESCGKCTPCRMGTSEARATLDALLAGAGTREHLDRLRSLAAVLGTSLCGLGTGAADPLRSALQHFTGDFEACVV